jgi:hypothetical protein
MIGAQQPTRVCTAIERTWQPADIVKHGKEAGTAEAD